MRDNTFKKQVVEFVQANPGLKRKQYVEVFVGFGMAPNAASLYHYLHVTKPNKIAKSVNLVNGAARDPRTGRFAKAA